MDITAVMPETTLPVECQAQTSAATARMDEETFRAFYERTARPVWAYLARITGDAQLADDLLQEAYYRFYRAGTVHENESHRRNSLFRIATNLARDRGRRRQRVIELPLPNQLDRAGMPADERSADRAVRRIDLARALDRLNPLQREILWLAYAQGSSHVDIAE